MDDITYFGIDISEYYSQICYFKDTMDEPASISAHAGTKKYLIPTVVAKRTNSSLWYIGDDALDLADPVKNILSKAFRKESVNVDGEMLDCIDLLTMFIRKVLALVTETPCDREKDHFIFCIDHATQMQTDTILLICDNLKINRDNVKVISRQEAFCYYAMSREPILRTHDVMLMDYWKNTFRVYELVKDNKTMPMVVSVKELLYPMLNHLSDNNNMTIDEFKDHKDSVFLKALDEVLADRIISSVYLVGDGFDGDWMKRSLARICAGRRVFSGMNLYTKGACYYGQMINRKFKNEPEYIYLGAGNMLYNICLKVMNKGELVYKVLVPAGYNYQDAFGMMDVIVRPSDDQSITFYAKPLRGDNVQEFTFTLNGLVADPELTTRLRIKGRAVSPERIIIDVATTGFGEIARTKHQSWQFEMFLKGKEEENV